MFAVMNPANGLIRYTAIMKHLRNSNESELVSRLERDVNEIGRTCSVHGYLDDPVVGVEIAGARLIIACPFCSGEEVLARWEAQEVTV